MHVLVLLIQSARSLFADDVRELVVQASSQIGHGPQPGRSNQNAAHTFGNLTRFILKQVGTAALFTGAALGGARHGRHRHEQQHIVRRVVLVQLLEALPKLMESLVVLVGPEW